MYYRWRKNIRHYYYCNTKNVIWQEKSVCMAKNARKDAFYAFFFGTYDDFVNIHKKLPQKSASHHRGKCFFSVAI